MADNSGALIIAVVIVGFSIAPSEVERISTALSNCTQIVAFESASDRSTAIAQCMLMQNFRISEENARLPPTRIEAYEAIWPVERAWTWARRKFDEWNSP